MVGGYLRIAVLCAGVATVSLATVASAPYWNGRAVVAELKPSAAGSKRVSGTPSAHLAWPRRLTRYSGAVDEAVDERDDAGSVVRGRASLHSEKAFVAPSDDLEEQVSVAAVVGISHILTTVLSRP